MLALVGAAPACRGGAARMQGHWRGVRAEGVPADGAAAANAFATGTELDVQGDSLTVIAPGSKQTGRYEVMAQDRTKVVLATDKDGPGRPADVHVRRRERRCAGPCGARRAMARLRAAVTGRTPGAINGARPRASRAA